jgi:hypothetical protein
MISFNKKKINEFCNITLLLTSIVFIVVYSSLNTDNRDFIAEILTNDIALFLAVITITAFTYYNLIGGFVVSIMFIILILPYFKKNRDASNNNAEGFTNNTNTKKGKKKKTTKIQVGGPEGEVEQEDAGLMDAFTGKGDRVEKFMEKVDKYKSYKKREAAFERLNNYDNIDTVDNNLNNNSLNDKSTNDKYNTHTTINKSNNDNMDDDILANMNGNNSRNGNNKSEKFNDQQTIKLRKFNPNDEFDNNLLLTKEICDDIKKRIVYEYETIPYLKRYISSRLQEIIDLLDLSA